MATIKVDEPGVALADLAEPVGLDLTGATATG